MRRIQNYQLLFFPKFIIIEAYSHKEYTDGSIPYFISYHIFRENNMKKLKFLPIILIFCLAAALFAVPAQALDAPEISSRAAVLLDRKTGEVLWSKNERDLAYPASTTKIMTVLLAVEAVETGTAALSDQVTASENITFDLFDDGSSAGIRPGETMSLEDLLYCAMLASANEACNVIAEAVGGSISGFVAMMNKCATDLGCTGTHFSNTHGLPDDNHYTTARDMSLIALEASRHPLFMEICGTAERDIPATNYSNARSLHSSNALINSTGTYGAGYLYERANGMKTGFTSAAGYCLVSTADDEDSGIELLAVVLGGSAADGKYTNFTDSITLLNWAFDNFSYQDVLHPEVNIASVDVHLGRDSDYVNLRPAGTVTLLLPNDYDSSEFDYDLQVYSIQQGKTVTAPVTAGEVLGEVSVLRDGQNVGTVKLVASSSVDLSRSQYIRSHILETIQTRTFRLIFWGMVLVLVLYLAWVVVYRVNRVKYKRAARAAQGGSHLRNTKPAAYQTVPEPDIEFFSQASTPAQSDPFAAPEVSPAQPPENTIPLSSIDRAAAQDTPPESETSLFHSASERDYFEEFFRQK